MAMFHRCCRRKEAMAQFAFALLWQKFENAVMFADDDADSLNIGSTLSNHDAGSLLIDKQALQCAHRKKENNKDEHDTKSKKKD